MPRRRRASGEGSLGFWEAKKLWVGRLTLPDGKRKTKYSKSQQVVKDWLLTERGKLSQGIYVSDERMTVEIFMNRWLEDHVKRSVRPSTYDIYKGWVNRHIIPELGHIRLSKLRADQINQFLTKMLERGLSTRSVEMMHDIFKHALNKAVKTDLLVKNPASLVSPPKPTYNVPKTWNSQEVMKFLDALGDDKWAGVYFLAMTGMRKGEILGLSMASLNTENGYLMVTQTPQAITGQGLVILTPKTGKSKRLIRLPDFVNDALKLHLTRREALSKNPRWKETGFVFTTSIGTPINPSNLVRDFKTKIRSLGLPDIPFHGLRHTAASLLLEKNVHPKLVSELLGHSTISLTLNTYSHVINPMNSEVANTMDNIFGKP